MVASASLQICAVQQGARCHSVAEHDRAVSKPCALSPDLHGDLNQLSGQEVGLIERERDPEGHAPVGQLPARPTERSSWDGAAALDRLVLGLCVPVPQPVCAYGWQTVCWAGK